MRHRDRRNATSITPSRLVWPLDDRSFERLGESANGRTVSHGSKGRSIAHRSIDPCPRWSQLVSTRIRTCVNTRISTRVNARVSKRVSTRVSTSRVSPTSLTPPATPACPAVTPSHIKPSHTRPTAFSYPLYPLSSNFVSSPPHPAYRSSAPPRTSARPKPYPKPPQ